MKTKSVMLAIVFGFGLGILPHQSDQANAACSWETDVYQRCAQEFGDALKNTVKYPKNTVSDAARRVRGASDALRNCINCAMETIKDGMDRVSSSPNGRTAK